MRNGRRISHNLFIDVSFSVLVVNQIFRGRLVPITQPVFNLIETSSSLEGYTFTRYRGYPDSGRPTRLPSRRLEKPPVVFKTVKKVER
jgi:hypothetical protein